MNIKTYENSTNSMPEIGEIFKVNGIDGIFKAVYSSDDDNCLMKNNECIGCSCNIRIDCSFENREDEKSVNFISVDKNGNPKTNKDK